VSKVGTLEELVGVVWPGMAVSFGGFAHSLTPMAFVRELVRRQVRDLTLVGIAEAWAADMLCGAGALGRMVFSNFMFEGFGLCRNFSRAIESGAVEFEDYSHFALASRFSAAAQGLPFTAVRSLLGSDLLGSDGGVQRIRHQVLESPFGGERVVLLPPVAPDVVVIHGHRGDHHGNVQVWGATSVIEEQARSGVTVLATVEQLVDAAVIRGTPERTLVPGMLVNRIAEVPYGAHPTGMYRLYDADYAHIREYVEASRDPAHFATYLAGVTGGGHRAYLARLGVRRLLGLRTDPHFGYHLQLTDQGWRP
jgi:acyl CoA:acetate/3-ketoacid CoA transferase alpha subunit